MIAKIEIYNDSGDLVSKYKAPPYEKWIYYDNDYEVRKYEFRFVYAEYVPEWQERMTKGVSKCSVQNAEQIQR